MSTYNHLPPLPDYGIDSEWVHVKGAMYRILHVGYDSETVEPVITYQLASGEGPVWTRPARMWEELVPNPYNANLTTKRFQRVR